MREFNVNAETDIGRLETELRLNESGCCFQILIRKSGGKSPSEFLIAASNGSTGTVKRHEVKLGAQH
ncbi:MAG: hypothetical protein ABI651_19950 [Verrucomicrobiota bacterium]